VSYGGYFLLAAALVSPQIAEPRPGSESCLGCHAGIEDAHPLHPLSCVECHGGNAGASRKEEAHVFPSRPLPSDERIVPLDYDLAWRRFRNPTDLRVVGATCGTCHPSEVSAFFKSLHGTTSGHLSDGLYENGVVADRLARFSLFPIADEDGEIPEHGYASIPGIPTFDPRRPRLDLATHFADVPRKACAQCHFYSEGRAVRGRLGFDGDYRAEGCAGCHMPYASDGLSRSGDPTVPKLEPGHPSAHRLTSAIPTSTCVSCHYGDASIGLHFRGLAQLVPGMPAGPNVKNTTDALENGVFYVRDPKATPPDVHHEKGLACIDCHTSRDAMGDGNLYGAMEHAVEIECVDCHGTFDRPSTLVTSRGAPLTHIRREGAEIVLRSKVSGKDHVVPQVVDVLNPGSPLYNERAAAAMTPAHGRLECYSCHAGWNVNFFGFHFDRNESFTQLDLLTGKRTPGRCTTQEKVFATFRRLTLGWNPEGAVSPYLVGFSTMGTVRDRSGEIVLDQRMPRTAADRSGMTMIHHDPHSTRPAARPCVDCHRAPATFGLGSPDFRLARDFVYVLDRRGLETVALDRRRPFLSVPVAKLPLPEPVDLAVETDPIQGWATRVFVAAREQGVFEIDVATPSEPRKRAFAGTVDPRGLALGGRHLFVADGPAGVRILDVGEPGRLRTVARVPTVDARAVALAWPWLFVADGAGGLVTLDVADAAHPVFLSSVDLNGANPDPDEALDVAVFYQYSRPDDGKGRRTEGRLLAVVAGGRAGLFLVDATEPSAPERIYPRARSVPTRGRENGLSNVSVALGSQFDLGDPGGEIPTEENDYAYVAVGTGREEAGQLVVVRITDPENPRPVSQRPIQTGPEHVALARVYNPPFVQTFAFVSGPRGVFPVDVSRSAQPEVLPRLPAIPGGRALAAEEFPFDRLVDEDGRPLKDISHEGARFFTRGERMGLLRVPGDAMGLLGGGSGTSTAFRGAIETLSRFDRDGDGRLGPGEGEARPSGEEAPVVGFAALFAAVRGTVASDATTSVAPQEASAAESSQDRTRRFWSALLDLPPEPMDRGGRRVSALARAVFDKLEADGRSGLDADELSRLPGETREIAWGGERGRAAFRRHDRNGDGRVPASEFVAPVAGLGELDMNADGLLDAEELPALRRRILGAYFTETLDEFRARYDRDGDGKIEVREFPSRAVLDSLDTNGDRYLDEAELTLDFQILAIDGVDALPDDFRSRFDLDRNGTVSPEEFPGARGALERLLGGSGRRAGG